MASQSVFRIIFYSISQPLVHAVYGIISWLAADKHARSVEMLCSVGCGHSKLAHVCAYWVAAAD